MKCRREMLARELRGGKGHTLAVDVVRIACTGIVIVIAVERAYSAVGCESCMVNTDFQCCRGPKLPKPA